MITTTDPDYRPERAELAPNQREAGAELLSRLSDNLDKLDALKKPFAAEIAAARPCLALATSCVDQFETLWAQQADARIDAVKNLPPVVYGAPGDDPARTRAAQLAEMDRKARAALRDRVIGRAKASADKLAGEWVAAKTARDAAIEREEYNAIKPRALADRGGDLSALLNFEHLRARLAAMTIADVARLYAKALDVGEADDAADIEDAIGERLQETIAGGTHGIAKKRRELSARVDGDADKELIAARKLASRIEAERRKRLPEHIAIARTFAAMLDNLFCKVVGIDWTPGGPMADSDFHAVLNGSKSLGDFGPIDPRWPARLIR